MSDFPPGTDPWLDARLRNVPLPVGLLRRLEQVADPQIERMNRALADVALPEGFLERLTEISRVEPRRRAWRVWRDRPWVALALAASLLLACGGYLAFTGGRMAPGVTPGRSDLAGDDKNQGGGALPTGAKDSLADMRQDDIPSSSIPSSNLAGGDIAGGDLQEGGIQEGGMRQSDRAAPAAFNPDDVSKLADDEALRAETEMHDAVDRETIAIPPAPAPRLPTVAGQDRRAAQPPDGRFRDGDVLGGNGNFQYLPDLEAVQVQLAHGIAPPKVAGYDLRFQLIHGQHPFVSPGDSPLLGSVQLPLVTSTAAWRRIARSVAEGRKPAPDDVRTEDFLAALDYKFPAAPRAGVAIVTAAGPAPLAEAGLSLLQVAVHAGEIAHEERPAAHVTLVVDCSRALRRSELWNAVEQSLNNLVDHMQPADRLTLVAFSEDAEALVEDASREALLQDGSGRLARALAAIEARPMANLAAGVQLACRLAAKPVEEKPAEGGAAPTRRMLIISGGRVDSGMQLSRRVQDRLAEMVASGVTADVVDLSRAERAAGSLDAWAKVGGRQLATAADPNALGWRLLESLAGHAPIVAERVHLKVTFNPDVVARYRLLGHERATLTGPADAQTEVDLRCGETATALFEVLLKPGVKDEVAKVEATWRRPNYGHPEHAEQPIVRGQFTAAFAASPTSLQMAAVAAYAAEALRGSYFSLPHRPLARVAELAKQVAKPIQDEPSFRELALLIDRAQRTPAHRPPGPKQSRSVED